MFVLQGAILQNPTQCEIEFIPFAKISHWHGKTSRDTRLPQHLDDFYGDVAVSPCCFAIRVLRQKLK